MNTEHATLEVLDRAHCLQLLGSAPFGRILYTAGALPVIQPVNYVLDGETIVIRTDSIAKLAVAGRREVVAFEIDDIDPGSGTGWSVSVTGHASEITAESELAHAQTLPFPGWVLDGPGRHIRIACELVTGRRLHRPPSDDHDPEHSEESAGRMSPDSSGIAVTPLGPAGRRLMTAISIPSTMGLPTGSPSA